MVAKCLSQLVLTSALKPETSAEVLKTFLFIAISPVSQFYMPA